MGKRKLGWFFKVGFALALEIWMDGKRAGLCLKMDMGSEWKTERNREGKEYFWWLDLFAGENLKTWEKWVYEWENEVKKVSAVGFFRRLDFFLPIFRFFSFSFLLSFIEGEVFEKVPPWTKKSPWKENGGKIRGKRRRLKSFKTSDYFIVKVFLLYKKGTYELSMNIQYGKRIKRIHGMDKSRVQGDIRWIKSK